MFLISFQDEADETLSRAIRKMLTKDTDANLKQTRLVKKA